MSSSVSSINRKKAGATNDEHHDNISDSIDVSVSDISELPGATLEHKLVAFVNSLNYNKTSVKSVWVEFDNTPQIFTSQFTQEFR